MIPTGCLGILWFQGYYDSNRMSWPHGISPISQHPSTSPNISQRFISNQLVHMVKCLSDVYSRKYILGTWKYVLGNIFSELGSMFSEVHSRNLKVCSWKYILGTWKYVLGSTFSELGSMFSEVHSRNLEVCSREYILLFVVIIPTDRVLLWYSRITPYPSTFCITPNILRWCFWSCMVLLTDNPIYDNNYECRHLHEQG